MTNTLPTPTKTNKMFIKIIYSFNITVTILSKTGGNIKLVSIINQIIGKMYGVMFFTNF